MISERDKIFIDYKRIKVEMQGISPKLSTYKNLEAQANELLKRLGGEKGLEKTLYPDGVKKAQADKRQKRDIERALEKPRPTCRVKECKNLAKLKRRNKMTGVKAWHPRCGNHQKKKTRYV